MSHEAQFAERNMVTLTTTDELRLLKRMIDDFIVSKIQRTYGETRCHVIDSLEEVLIIGIRIASVI